MQELHPLQLQMGVTLWRWSINPATHIKNLKIKKIFHITNMFLWLFFLYSFPYAFIYFILNKPLTLKKSSYFPRNKGLNDVLYRFFFWEYFFICIFFVYTISLFRNIKCYTFYCFENYFFSFFNIGYLIFLVSYYKHNQIN